jgi:hypothetical protein
MTWMKICYFNEIDNMNKKRDEFGDRNKIDHMDGVWTILLKNLWTFLTTTEKQCKMLRNSNK